MIIGFGHKAQTGKDTAGNYLVEWYGFTRVAFGDKLKEMCSFLTGISFDQFFGEAKHIHNETWGMTHREMAQRMGTDAIRNGFHTDSWIISTLADKNPNHNYVITDVRFLNEVDGIHEKGGDVVRIVRDTSGYDIDRTHASETGLDDYHGWDYVIDNDKDYNWFRDQLDGIMRSRGIKKRTKFQHFIHHTVPNAVKTIWKWD